jgi:hypothetical protein
MNRMSDKESSQNEPSFRVSDRRLFNASGERRPDVPEPPAPPAPPAEPAKPAAPPEPAQPAPAPDPLFLGLIENLVLNASYQLGQSSDDPMQPPQLDLEGARETIDLLGMLQRKTRGNLAEEEARYLEQVVFQLRSFYTRIVQQAAGTPRPQR